MIDKNAKEQLEIIANKGLELIKRDLETRSQNTNASTLVKASGEALKALAEGIESYKKAMEEPTQFIVPKN